MIQEEDSRGQAESRRPIFIVGASRSGTFLLSQTLSRHRRLYIYDGETHFFDDLLQRRNMRKVTERMDLRMEAVQYFLRLDAGHYALPGDPGKSHIDESELESRARAHGSEVVAYFRAFCELCCEDAGKQRWGEKTPRHVFQTGSIREAFPEAQIIHIVRDPRAVLASSRQKAKVFDKRPTFGGTATEDARTLETLRLRNSYHPVNIALLWRASVNAGWTANEVSLPGGFLEIRFEDLVSDPATVMMKVCQFLGEEYDPGLLDVPYDNSSFDEAPAQRGFQRDVAERWRTVLSPEEIAVIQLLCRREMAHYGYATVSVNAKIGKITQSLLGAPFAMVRAAVANRKRMGNWRRYLFTRAIKVLARH